MLKNVTEEVSNRRKKGISKHNKSTNIGENSFVVREFVPVRRAVDRRYKLQYKFFGHLRIAQIHIPLVCREVKLNGTDSQRVHTTWGIRYINKLEASNVTKEIWTWQTILQKSLKRCTDLYILLKFLTKRLWFGSAGTDFPTIVIVHGTRWNISTRTFPKCLWNTLIRSSMDRRSQLSTNYSAWSIFTELPGNDIIIPRYSFPTDVVKWWCSGGNTSPIFQRNVLSLRVCWDNL